MNEKQNFYFPRLSIGCCYYPEHWGKKMWENDLERMLQNGIRTVRVGEFAWSRFEEREGDFDFGLFDAFLETAHRMGMQVIFSTPTATPPAWLTEKYPEVLNARKDGVLIRHGMRRHYNYNSPVYQEFCKRIVRRLGERYGGHPAVIGWQIDNELNCEINEFYSQSDTLAFRSFLREKYQTLRALNDAWGTVFWNQTYTAWEEVFVPRITANGAQNPHLLLDYIRFLSESTLAFCRMQADLLRAYVKPGDFITTNGIFGHMDNHRMEKESLDIYTYDSYPNFAYALGRDPKRETDLNDRKWSRNLTEVRSVCRHFGIMEQQSGSGSWVNWAGEPSPKPGQLSLWAMQSVAHGADYISFFRWRTSTVGTEIYWNGILDCSGRPTRRLAEVKAFSEDVKKLECLTGAEYEAAFAQIRDYDNLWDAEIDGVHGALNAASDAGIFQAAQLSHTPMDYVYLQQDSELYDLQKYPVLFYPHAVILTKERAALLLSYVRAGGTLILGCRAGWKQENGQCVEMLLPGLLREASGADVYESTCLGPADAPQSVQTQDAILPAAVFCDLIRPLEEGISRGTYTADYYAGVCAMTEKKLGDGRILYYGSAFTKEAAAYFLSYCGIVSPHDRVLSLPQECELAVRRCRDQKRCYLVLNYSGQRQRIFLRETLYDMLAQKEAAGPMEIAPYGYACLLKLEL